MPVYVPGGLRVIPIEAIEGLPEALSEAQFAPSTSESGASRTSSLSDAGEYIRFTNVGAKTYTVISDSWPTSCEIHGRNAAEGDLTLVPDTGVTLHPPYLGTLVIPVGGTFTIKRVGDTDEWDVFGQTVPV